MHKTILIRLLQILFILCLLFTVTYEYFQWSSLSEQESEIIKKSENDSIHKNNHPKKQDKMNPADVRWSKITSVLESSGLQVMGMVPSKKQGIIVVDYQLQGSFSSLMKFIQDIHSEKMIFSIQKMQLKRIKNGNLDIQLTMIFLPFQSSVPHLLPVKNQRHDPFNQFERKLLENSRRSLWVYPVGEMKNMGYIAQGKIFSAIVMTPSHEFFNVQAGEIIGTEKAIVKFITKNKIIVQEGNHEIEIH